jgi:hypothetical protein
MKNSSVELSTTMRTSPAPGEAHQGADGGKGRPRLSEEDSLKGVLPTLVPDLSYDAMEVSEGSEAGLAWEGMIRGNVEANDRNSLRAALLEYCKLDTLARVRLLEVLAAA